MCICIYTYIDVYVCVQIGSIGVWTRTLHTLLCAVRYCIFTQTKERENGFANLFNTPARPPAANLSRTVMRDVSCDNRAL